MDEEIRKRYPSLYDDIFVKNNYGVEEVEIKGTTVFDVGANVGFFSLYAIERGASKVIAFEPNPATFELLSKNINQGNIFPINVAVAEPGVYKLHIEGEHEGSTAVVDGDGPEVYCVYLQMFLAGAGTNNVLKIDCEGAEFDIIPSLGKQELRQFKYIYLEAHGDKGDTGSLIQCITEAGFSVVERPFKFGMWYDEPGGGKKFVPSPHGWFKCARIDS